MICPKCKSEYRDGFYRCSSCDVDLVSELPSESAKEEEFIEWEEVLATNKKVKGVTKVKESKRGHKRGQVYS